MATPIQEISDLWLDLKNQFYAGTRTHYWTPEQYNRFMDLISDGLYTKLTGDEARRTIPQVVDFTRALMTFNEETGNYEKDRFMVPLLRIIAKGVYNY